MLYYYVSYRERTSVPFAFKRIFSESALYVLR